MKKFVTIIIVQMIFNFAFSQNIQYVDTIGKKIGFSSPEGISVNSSGDIYVADTGNNRIIKMDFNGKLQKSEGGLGWGENQFDSPVDIWAKSNLDVLVADRNNRRIVRYDKNLNFINFYPSESTDYTELGYPVSTVISGQGDIFILDAQNKNIVKLEILTGSAQTFGDISNSFFPLLTPLKMEISRNNKIFVSDKGRNMILSYDLYGNLLNTVSGFENIEGFCFDTVNRLFVLDKYNLKIYKDLSLLNEYNLKDILPGIIKPVDLDILDNNIFILDEEKSVIFHFVIDK